MRSPEEQQRFLEHGRFHEKPDGTPIKPPGVPRWVRLGCLSLLAAALAIFVIVVSLRFLGRHITKNVAGDTRVATAANRPRQVYGYSVETYRWNNLGFRVRFHSDRYFHDIRLDFPTLNLFAVRQHSWLAGDRAILLALEYDTGDSLHSGAEMSLLYDFARGELRACGLERVWTLSTQSPAAPDSSCNDLRAFAATLK